MITFEIYTLDGLGVPELFESFDVSDRDGASAPEVKAKRRQYPNRRTHIFTQHGAEVAAFYFRINVGSQNNGGNLAVGVAYDDGWSDCYHFVAGYGHGVMMFGGCDKSVMKENIGVIRREYRHLNKAARFRPDVI